MDQPMVSVIIPVYNGEVFLAEAVESIRQQSYEPLEIIAVDDGSTDGSATVAKSLEDGIRYIYQSNRGPAAARNTGLKLARGELIAFLDQDDLWPPYKLALQAPCLLEDPALDLVSGRVQMMRLVGVRNGKYEFEEYSRPWIHMLLSSALFRRSVFDKVGFFDETLKYYGNDFDWFMRAREQGVSMLILDEVTLYWRIHEENQTHDKSIRDHSQGRDHALMEILKKSLDRRRQFRDGEAVPVPRFSDFDESAATGHTGAGQERAKSTGA